RVAGALHRVARDADGIHGRGPRGVVVPPVVVLEGAGGDHLHVVAAGQAPQEPAAMGLGAAGDLQPVALDHEAEPHRPSFGPGSRDSRRRSRAATFISRRTTSRTAFVSRWNMYWLIWVWRSRTWSV